MIYQMYGFNILCDQYIDQLSEYIFESINEDLPIVNTLLVDKIEEPLTEGIEVSNELVRSLHAKQKCFFEFIDGGSILFSPNEIVFCGKCFDLDRIEGEISRADIIILSRFHKRAVLHGSAFCYQGKAYLICANPGAGKSTLSSAMVKYHKDVSFITDDIICVENSGVAIFNGVHKVSLNDDSSSTIMEAIKNNLSEGKSINSSPAKKTTHDLHNGVTGNQIIAIGGVFFLQTPCQEDLIKIDTLSKLELFCELLKNVKYKQALVNGLLQQEMDIVNRMSNSSIWGAKLQIEHNYSKLRVVTDMIIDFINRQDENGTKI